MLEENINQIIHCCKLNNIYILICDNSEDDKIKKYYLKSKNIYSKIDYIKNINEKNFDYNCLNALKYIKTKYVWTLGDGLIIKEDKIKKILEYLSLDYTGIIFDYYDRIKKYEIKEIYEDPRELFKDLGWHITLLGSTILKRDFIEESLVKNYEKYIGTYFMHMGIFLESISNQKFEILVTKEMVCYHNPLKKTSTWNAQPFKTFGSGWINFIKKLPNIYDENKEFVIKSHGINSGLFSLKGLIAIHMNTSEYDIKEILENKDLLRKITNIPLPLICLVWLLPKKLLKRLNKIRKDIIKCKK